MRRAFLVCGLVLSFVGVAMAGLSGTYTVKPQGGGNFASFTELTDTLAARGISGDCIFLIDSGDYAGNNFFISAQPVSDTFVVTVMPAPGQHVVYNGHNWGFDLLETPIRVRVFDIVFAYGSGVSINYSMGARIQGCTFRNTYLSLDEGYGDTVVGNRLATCMLSDCRDEVVVNNSFSGSDSTSYYVCLPIEASSGTRVYYNTFYVPANAQMSACCNLGYDTTEARNNAFVILRDSADAALDWNSSAGFVHTTDYNCFWPASPATAVYDEHTDTHCSLAEWQATGQDLHGIEVDPMVTGGGDPHLLEGSPCIGAGVPIPGFQYDIDGDPRDPVHPDIGCDEFTGAGVVDAGRQVPVATLSVTPNPTSGSVMVSAPAQTAMVDVYDATGRRVRRMALNSGRATISGLAPGVYVLRAGAASAKLTVTD